MSIKSLGYMGCGVMDVPAWRSFLAQKLGLMEAGVTDDGALFRIDSRAWRIAVQQGEADDLAYAGYEVADAAGLTQMTEKLRQAGIEVVTGDVELAKRRGVMGLILFADPFGLPLEIPCPNRGRSNRPCCVAPARCSKNRSCPARRCRVF